MGLPKDPIKLALWKERQSKAQRGRIQSKEEIEKRRISRMTGIHKAHTVRCANCGKELKRRPCRSKGRNYCNNKCQMEYEYANGIRNPKTIMNKFHSIGRKLMKEGSHPLLQKEARDKLRAIMKTKEYRDKLKGENNYNWKGGANTVYEAIRKCFEYRQWRSDVFTRDNFTCQMCGDNRGGNLHAHHIKPFSKIIQKYEITTFEEALECEELWNLNNGITLCKKCHIKIHKQLKNKELTFIRK